MIKNYIKKGLLDTRGVLQFDIDPLTNQYCLVGKVYQLTFQQTTRKAYSSIFIFTTDISGIILNAFLKPKWLRWQIISSVKPFPETQLYLTSLVFPWNFVQVSVIVLTPIYQISVCICHLSIVMALKNEFVVPVPLHSQNLVCSSYSINIFQTDE